MYLNTYLSTYFAQFEYIRPQWKLSRAPMCMGHGSPCLFNNKLRKMRITDVFLHEFAM